MAYCVRQEMHLGESVWLSLFTAALPPSHKCTARMLELGVGVASRGCFSSPTQSQIHLVLGEEKTLRTCSGMNGVTHGHIVVWCMIDWTFERYVWVLSKYLEDWRSWEKLSEAVIIGTERSKHKLKIKAVCCCQSPPGQSEPKRDNMLNNNAWSWDCRVLYRQT